MRTLTERRHRDHGWLLARDLNAELAADARRRALHVLGVHRTWGVALGFAIEAGQDDSELRVGPGFGYDCRGRAIVSPRPTTVPVPEAPGATDLVVSATHGIRFAWREPGHACEDELVLARHCRSRRFRLAAGIAYVELAREVEVATSSGAFNGEPAYFATLESQVRLAATLEVTDESPWGFILVLRAPASQWVTSAGAPARVHWTGVERLPVCDIDDDEKEKR